MRLGQFRERLGQCLQRLHGRSGLALPVLNAAEQEAHLRVGGLGFQVLFGLGLCFGPLLSHHQAVHILVNVRVNTCTEHEQNTRQYKREEGLHARQKDRVGAAKKGEQGP